MATLRIRQAAVTFASVPALDDVTLEVERGEWLALIGPNGAGKTTLLRAIAAAIPLDSGVVMLGDDDVALLKPRARARRMAVVPQEHTSVRGWTVEQIVAQGRAPHLGAWRSEGHADLEAIAQALRDTDTAALAEREVDTLSGGERQRVYLARALAQMPVILLLDEPTAFLDLQYQWEMLELVQRVRLERGITVVSVLHDLNLAAAFAGRIALLKGGRILSMGTPEAVLTEDTIRRGYNRRVSISRHPATGRPIVISWPSEHTPIRHSRVHVVSGGGSGAALIRRLVADGHTVTAGALNVGDTDWEAARALGVETAEEAPFSPLSRTSLDRAEALIREADAVLVAPMPIGPGNLDNLRLAKEAAERGQRVLLVGQLDVSRDFTGGKAVSLWDAAVRVGAEEVPDSARATSILADTGAGMQKGPRS
ncbi:MAG TPA: ABC transporter ATP-binding protein [Armatimonadota bacterium]|jgi:iron complex transport system ATP-binding protein